MASTKILSSTLSMIILSSVPAVATNNTIPLANHCVDTFSMNQGASHLGSTTYSAIKQDAEVNEINSLMMKVFTKIANEPNEQFIEIDKLISDNLIDLM